jgi:hypothetical protein
MGRLEQWALWRTFKFYLALENHLCEGYLTEKAYKSLIRGQVGFCLVCCFSPQPCCVILSRRHSSFKLSQPAYSPAFPHAQVPVYLGAPEVAELMPPGSYIDASRFKTGAELGASADSNGRVSSSFVFTHSTPTCISCPSCVLYCAAAYLKYLDTHDDAYMEYHAWRYASFETYPLQFRRVVISLVNLLAAFGPGRHGEYMSCLMCYTVQDWAEKNNWDPPTPDAFKQGIKPWQCFPEWPNYVPPAYTLSPPAPV